MYLWKLSSACSLLYTFPFEGNWNLWLIVPPFSLASAATCYTLSRLKGIETIVRWMVLLFNLTCYTLSRLKGIETRVSLPMPAPLHTCYTLSRLKGIETDNVLTIRADVKQFLACYTLSRLKGIETTACHCPCIPLHLVLLYTFPFEGNWNVHVNYFIKKRSENLLYTFPFEGNWNQSVNPIRYRHPPCYTLSRLKGIETTYHTS